MNRHQRRVAGSTGGNLPSAKVLVAVPSGTMWHAGFGMCLVQLMLDTALFPTPGFEKVEAGLTNKKGSVIWRQRTELVQQGLDEGFTHLLFIDSDQTFPSSTLRRLLVYSKAVVAANVATKGFPARPTARRAGEIIYTWENSKGLEEVSRIGTGIMMIDLSIMPSVPKPWFSASGIDEDGEQYGEDWWFCQQLERAAIPIYIDHDLSWEVGHLGEFEYCHRHVEEK